MFLLGKLGYPLHGHVNATTIIYLLLQTTMHALFRVSWNLGSKCILDITCIIIIIYNMFKFTLYCVI